MDAGLLGRGLHVNLIIFISYFLYFEKFCPYNAQLSCLADPEGLARVLASARTVTKAKTAPTDC